MTLNKKKNKEIREAALIKNYSERKKEKLDLIILGLGCLSMDELDDILKYLRKVTKLELELTIEKLV